MNEQIKKALLNIKDFEEKFYKKYAEKQALEKKVNDVANRSNIFYNWGVERSLNVDAVDNYLPKKTQDRSQIARIRKDLTEGVMRSLDKDGSRCTVATIKNGIFKNAPQDMQHLKDNKEYDSKIAKYASEVNSLKSNLKTTMNEKFDKLCGAPGFGIIFLVLMTGIFAIIFFALSVALQGLKYIDVNPGGLRLLGLVCATITLFLIIKMTKSVNKEKNIEELGNAIKSALKDYNLKSATLYLDVIQPLTNSYIEAEKARLEEEIKVELEKVEEEIKQIGEEYHSGATLSNEMLDLYFSLDAPEKDLFIKLGMLADNEKELTDVYMKCLDNKNKRLILEEERQRTQEAKTQTMLSQQHARELERQTQIMKEEAAAQENYMRTMARQNAEMAKSQEAYNKQQLATAKKQLETTKKLKAEQEYANYLDRNK